MATSDRRAQCRPPARAAEVAGRRKELTGRKITRPDQITTPSLTLSARADCRTTTEHRARACKSGNGCVLLVRPEAVRLAPKTPGCAEAVVLDRTVAGALQEYALRLSAGRRWRARIDLGQKRFNVGEVVGVAFDPGSAFVF